MADPITTVREAFPDAVLKSEVYRDTPIITIKAESLLEVGRFLRDDPALQYNLLSDLTVVDRLKLDDGDGDVRFHGIYQLRSVERDGDLLQIKTPLPGGDYPTAFSVTGLWPSANWYEREAYDLFGVTYEGHPDLRRILMPDDWPGHPLRKDQPLGGERVPFTITWDDEDFAHLGKQLMQAEQKAEPVPGRMDSKHMVINMGPQHPATHGVLRLIVELDGERVIAVQPDIGYLHSGFEKQGENIRYKDFVYYTDRMDYVSAMQNNLAYCLAVEKLLDIEAPPRGQAIRVIVCEMQRIASHLVWLATHALDVGGTGLALLMYAFREREDILDLFEMVCGARLTTSYLRVGGVSDDLPPAFIPKLREFLEYPAWAFRRIRAHAQQQPCLASSFAGHWHAQQGTGHRSGRDGTNAPGQRRQVRSAQGPAPIAVTSSTISRSPPIRKGIASPAIWCAWTKCGNRFASSIRHSTACPTAITCIDNPKIAPPKRELLDQSMEAVIHHFKLFTEGFQAPER